MTADLFPEIPHRCEADPQLIEDLERDSAATFTCSRCGLEVCSACHGAADEHPDLCNTCWAKAPRRAL